jgi:ABC-type amino acid transport substrate-binding protein
VNEYVLWLKAKKKINVVLKQVGFPDFESFYAACKRTDKNSFGLGSVTINQERAKEIDFSAAYLKNVAFCVTNGHAPDVKTKNPDEIMRSLGSMSALTINNTSLNKYVIELKKQYIQDLKISYHTDEIKILDEISKNVLYFGYVDAVGFWFYLKNNPGKFLKMQKILNQSREELGFIMPKGSQHKMLFNEFFSGPNGFKTNPNYRAILEKYLGAYMTQNMAVN